jgi:hypothetical protein
VVTVADRGRARRVGHRILAQDLSLGLPNRDLKGKGNGRGKGWRRATTVARSRAHGACGARVGNMQVQTVSLALQAIEAAKSGEERWCCKVRVAAAAIALSHSPPALIFPSFAAAFALCCPPPSPGPAHPPPPALLLTPPSLVCCLPSPLPSPPTPTSSDAPAASSL